MNNSLKFGFVVVYVADIAKATRFYTESLGLRVERQAPTFVQFEHFAIATDEALGDGQPEVYWLVDDADLAYRDISAKAAISRPLETKPFGKVFGVRDPDERTRFVLELAKTRPSQAT